MEPDAAPAVTGEPDRDLFGRTPRDRPDWSHRRGEPRLFAVLWMLYLMAGSVVMLTSIAAAKFISPSVTRPAATAMLVATMAGVCVLWPAMRLSQEAPARPGRAVVSDLVVLLVPVYALIAPQALWFLSHWPPGVIVAAGLAFTAWGALVGAVLAIALRTVGRAGSARVRAAWAGLFVAGVLAVPALVGVGAVGRGGASGSAWAMGSPLTAVAEIVRPREATGRAARVGPQQWRALGVTFVVSGAAWGVAAGFGLVRRGDGA